MKPRSNQIYNKKKHELDKVVNSVFRRCIVQNEKGVFRLSLRYESRYALIMPDWYSQHPWISQITAAPA